MKFKKVPNVAFFSKYQREDGAYTITSKDMVINGHMKGVFIVENAGGEMVEIFNRLKDAKEAYSA